ncbi:MAG: septum formation protein Maf [Verrucomicrobiales bacterium]|nr:septum formation protein Maf [Verrucomicrobiales bacterium]
MPPLILASGSPRRAELLQQAGFDFTVHTSPAEERHDPTARPAELTLHNARLKAAAIATAHPDAFVIGADTLVYVGTEPLGKPRDLAEAATMLRQLSDRTHQVTTGVVVLQGNVALAELAITTRVTFLPLTDERIAAYHRLCPPLDKAGGYGIQTAPDLIIAHWQGSLSNVIGLPVEELSATLRSHGLETRQLTD